MKRTLLAAALCAISASVCAQQPTDVPAPKCEPKPQRMGGSLLSDPRVRRTFEREVKVYRECMLAYIEERKAVVATHEKILHAHRNAANAAVEEYNATVKSLEAPDDDKSSKKSGY
jgi:hypothetical protein